MALFEYKARDHSGKLVSGQLEGRDKALSRPSSFPETSLPE